MGDRGVDFTGGGEADLMGGSPGSTQPNPPGRSSGGPVVTPDGLDTGSNHSKTTPSWDAKEMPPMGGGKVLDSPMDK